MDEKSEMISRILYLMTKESKKKSQILRELNLSTSTLSDWQKGKGNPSSSAIIKLAKYFNVSSDYILFGTEKVDGKELTPLENKWLQVYDTLSEPEKQSILEMVQLSPDSKDMIVCLNYLQKLTDQEREVCLAFIRGLLAEKDLTEK